MIGKQVGAGRTADIFMYGEGRVVKVFHPFCQGDWIQAEVERAAYATEKGIKTPAFHQVVDVKGRTGVVYDYVEGDTLGDSFAKHLLQIPTLAKKAAAVHYGIHQVSGQGIPRKQGDLIHSLQSLEALDQETKEALIAYSEALPVKDIMCHGDLHVENFILSGDDLWAIDWMGAYSGHPACDIARTKLLLESPAITRDLRGPRKWLVSWVLETYVKHFIKAYCQLSGMDPMLVDRFMPLVAALRIQEEIPHEEAWLLGLVKERLSAS